MADTCMRCGEPLPKRGWLCAHCERRQAERIERIEADKQQGDTAQEKNND